MLLLGSKGLKTLAMCWVFHRRAFAVSGSLFSSGRRAESLLEALSNDGIDEIRSLSNSNLNSAVDTENHVEQNSDVRFLKVGFDLFGNSIFEKVGKWRLYGFCLRDGVKWSDWRMHFVSGSDLRFVRDVGSFIGRKHVRSCRCYYDFVEPVCVVDVLSKCLIDFC